MTVFLNDLYAVRFPLDVGSDANLQAGTFRIRGKSESGQDYRDRNGQLVKSGASNNPYGQYWMDLGNGLSIHTRSTQDSRGCIRIDPKHVADVYGILSEQSEVKVLR